MHRTCFLRYVGHTNTNITTAAGDVTMWVCESPTVWHLLSWMDVSSDLSGAGGF